MMLVLLLLPFLGVFAAAVILAGAGRSLREKITIFIVTPDDADATNTALISILRFFFWVMLGVSVWMWITMLRSRG